MAAMEHPSPENHRKLSLAWPPSRMSPKRLTASLRIEAPAKMSTPTDGSTHGMVCSAVTSPASLPRHERYLRA